MTRFTVSCNGQGIQASVAVDVLHTLSSPWIIFSKRKNKTKNLSLTSILFHCIFLSNLDGGSFPQLDVGSLQLFANEAVELQRGTESCPHLPLVVDLQQRPGAGQLGHELLALLQNGLAADDSFLSIEIWSDSLLRVCDSQLRGGVQQPRQETNQIVLVWTVS